MMRVSIVVPALNEARTIVATLISLQPLRTAGHEVIVVDGGSVDATAALSAPLADRIVVAAKGRALQMNAGAAIATGEVLLFLHADSCLPENGITTMVRELNRSGRRWGRFDITIAGRNRVLQMVAALMNLRSRATGIATGDQGIFVERALFDAVAGFPSQPLMEDIEISRRLKRAAGAPLCLRQRIVTSARRWERHGAWRTILAMWRWRLAYSRGTDPELLVAEYHKAPSPTRVTLQVFAKSPVPGQVKTRLARAIGDEAAAALHSQFVERTLVTAIAARAAGIVDRVELWCAPDVDAPAFATWQARFDVALQTQIGDDLGSRMRNALDSALIAGGRAILIGTDCPTLDILYLAHAVAALDRNDAVFGPAEDGGYVLVGLRRSLDAFSSIPWSTSEVMAMTRARLRKRGASWQELPQLWDVDDADDLFRWNALTASPAAQAPQR